MHVALLIQWATSITMTPVAKNNGTHHAAMKFTTVDYLRIQTLNPINQLNNLKARGYKEIRFTILLICYTIYIKSTIEEGIFYHLQLYLFLY